MEGLIYVVSCIVFGLIGYFGASWYRKNHKK
ncbi:MAG: hypothetical protein PWP53_3771 [Lacrimispora sp.]|jgi:predicted acyltransferase|nr:hypothetical protein [Lacrimispora sp.]